MNTKRTDILKALIINKKREFGYTDADLAVLIGVSAPSMSRWMKYRHTNDWKYGHILSVCDSLGIPPEDIVKVSKF